MVYVCLFTFSCCVDSLCALALLQPSPRFARRCSGNVHCLASSSTYNQSVKPDPSFPSSLGLYWWTGRGEKEREDL